LFEATELIGGKELGKGQNVRWGFNLRISQLLGDLDGESSILSLVSCLTTCKLKRSGSQHIE
jgi:hypothetical protein